MAGKHRKSCLRELLRLSAFKSGLSRSLRAWRRKPLWPELPYAVVPVIVGMLTLVSCASSTPTVPVISEVEGGEFSPLAEGALAYMYVDVTKARPILDAISFKGMNEGQGAQVLDRTNSAVAAFYPEGSPRRFLAAARGTYPKTWADMALTFSASWKRHGSGASSYWRSDKDNLSVALGSSRALVSDGSPFAPSPGVEAPADFDEFRRDALLAGWMEDGASPINRYLSLMEIPIEIPAGRVFFSLYESGKQYEGALRIETPSVSQAKALVTLFSMARIFLEPSSPVAAFFANLPVQDGSSLNLRSGSLTEKEIALLFNMFLVYSG